MGSLIFSNQKHANLLTGSSQFITFFLLLVLSPFSISSNLGISYNYSLVELPVEIEQKQTELTSALSNIQANIVEQNWMMGISISQAKQDKSWQLDNNSLMLVEFEQSSFDLFLSYNADEWTYGISIGQSQYDYQQKQSRLFPNENKPFIDLQQLDGFQSDDNYYEVNLGYWFNLNEYHKQLSLSFDGAVSYYQSTVHQSSVSQDLINELLTNPENAIVTRYIESNNINLGIKSANEYQVKDHQWLLGLTTSLSQDLNWFNQNLQLSLWHNFEFSTDSEGVLISTRINRRRPFNVREFPLDQLGQQQKSQTISSYGIDVSWEVSDEISLSSSAYKSEQTDWQWLIGISYWF